MEKLKPYEEHRLRGPKKLRFSLYTVSSSRYKAKISREGFKDDSMEVAVNLIEREGYEIVEKDVIDDDVVMIRKALENSLSREDVDVVVFMGGTGLAKRDVTIEAVRPLFEKEIEGFGEIFRFESYKQIGAAAAFTRATAGVINNRVVICLPGSPDAVELAFKIFLRELPHLVYISRT
ncbi:MAG: MogA/MoaB family molybdenum cofactor biosynthesis protein [Nitrososphaerota archaeon]|nr:MogA/MoaB family molybdenum cofactor biosynthesis protein [Candidatus Geocrenenecus dongiae]